MSDNIADKKDHFRTLAARSIPWFGIFPKADLRVVIPEMPPASH
jgi:hypothetical protein